ncbi:hypothetical protein [Actinomadura mexicana]|uniref:Uncharacterized protein n=1 Tax=Actinomadura mexicana TaxID=134959 RepID=A0A238VMJ1_9ACTN|nr:hypothetical protein [Actinomadura mexicana]SNR34953.1 hypothetical protein SAMN06265355_1023 [Actinomadura mexicana]
MHDLTDVSGDPKASIPGQWPGGEPDDVRDMARRRGDLAQRADDLAARLEAELYDGIEVDLGLAVREAAEANRAFAAACRNGDEEEFDRALRETSRTIARCVDLVEALDSK